jgi:hypothetical protein
MGRGSIFQMMLAVLRFLGTRRALLVRPCGLLLKTGYANSRHEASAKKPGHVNSLFWWAAKKTYHVNSLVWWTAKKPGHVNS